MRVPTQIMIGGRKLKIEYKDELPDDKGGQLSGEFICGENTVRISKSKNKDEAAVFRTLFHEALHFSLELTGHSAEWTAAVEEPLVYALENMMADLFVFSPEAPVKYREIPWPDNDDE